MKQKLLLTLLLISQSFSAFSGNCSIDELLESMGLDPEIQTIFEFKTELRKQEFGGTLYEDIFFRYLDEINPYFKTDGELELSQVQWAKQLVDSGNLDRFKRAVHYVAINSSSGIPMLDAKYAIGIELAKLDSIFLSNNYISDIKVVATHDNVTTYWKHLDGVPVRGHPDGVTWNSIEGAGAPDGETELVIALVKNEEGKWVLPNGNHGSSNIVLHEYGHALDKIMGKIINGKKLSSDPEFYRAWYNEYSSGSLKDGYYTQPENNYESALEETFAEGLSKYFSQDGVSHTDWRYVSNYIQTVLMPIFNDPSPWSWLKSVDSKIE